MKTAKEYNDPVPFHNEVVEFYADNYDYAWIIETETAQEYRPVGLVLGIVAGQFLMLGDVQWFPWATTRNKIEGITQLLTDMRKTDHVVFHCEKKHMTFYNHIAKHGVIRRVGTLNPANGNSLALYETRKPEH